MGAAPLLTNRMRACARVVTVSNRFTWVYEKLKNKSHVDRMPLALRRHSVHPSFMVQRSLVVYANDIQGNQVTPESKIKVFAKENLILACAWSCVIRPPALPTRSLHPIPIAALSMIAHGTSKQYNSATMYSYQQYIQCTTCGMA